jgi:hypothetical protein
MTAMTVTNAGEVSLSSNAWRLFTWPYAARQFESAGSGGDQGWGFQARGGLGGLTHDTADRLFGLHKGVPFDLYLYTNGRWYVKGTTVSPDIALENGLGYFYFRRGTSFVWRATEAP